MSNRGRGGPPRGQRGANRGGRGGRGRGNHFLNQRPSDDDSYNSHDTHKKNEGRSTGDMVDVRVVGWRQSKAAEGTLDGGIGTLRAFLEKKTKYTPITKARLEGEAYVVSVPPEFVDRFLQISNFSFAGAPLLIERSLDTMQTGGPGTEGSMTTTEANTRDALMQFLGSRYDATNKLLNLSALKHDPQLQALGVFASESIANKFFPVLMKLCDETWPSAEKKAEAVLSVSLTLNELHGVLPVTSLAATLPRVKHLDLSNNKINDYDGLKFWRWKFRELETLLLTENGVDKSTDLVHTMKKWYPRLLVLDGQKIRTAEEVEKEQNPLPQLPPFFQDESDIAAKFLTTFFPLFDSERASALQKFYDLQSTFSYSANTQAKRQKDETTTSTWDPLIKHSRNLLRITHLHSRETRRYLGKEIEVAWARFPRTRHPPLDQHPAEWLIECHPLAGLQDNVSNTPGGIGGLIITVHGSFHEYQEVSGKAGERRSFDRTFVLGPGDGVGGIRVISDILVLRSYGGFEAWNTSYNRSAVPSLRRHPEIDPGSGIGEPAPGKSPEQLQKEVMAIELSLETRMKLEFSVDCLQKNDWDMKKAYENAQELAKMGQLPPQALLTIS